MNAAKVDPGALVGEIMDRWPETVPVFIKYQMGCAGCSMAKFETLEDALKIYEAPIDLFLNEIEQSIKDKL